MKRLNFAYCRNKFEKDEKNLKDLTELNEIKNPKCLKEKTHNGHK
jgi:hypothetical protein